MAFTLGGGRDLQGDFIVARHHQKRHYPVRAYLITGVIVIIGAFLIFRPGKRESDDSAMLAGERQTDNLSDALIKLDNDEESGLSRPRPEPSGGAAPETEPGEKTPAKAEPPPPATSRPAVVIDSAQARQAYQQGVEARQRDELLEARTLLNRALRGNLPDHDAESAREALRELGAKTIFSKAIIRDDPLVEDYVVKWGDSLGKIARNHDVSEDMLAEVNQLPNKNFIRQGQRMKVLRGPFHATISKSKHLMHIHLQDTYVETFRVALGTNGGTPTGVWEVKDQLVNPSWVDPRTGQRWHADDPKNPIGEYWIGLEGIEGDAVGQFGYGIHGTIEPEKIGQNVSMGCVRLAADDIARVFRMLVPDKSRVTIVD